MTMRLQSILDFLTTLTASWRPISTWGAPLFFKTPSSPSCYTHSHTHTQSTYTHPHLQSPPPHPLDLIHNTPWSASPQQNHTHIFTMARHAKLNTSSIPAKSLNPFREWCRSQELPEDSQNSYERYLDAQKSKQGASKGGRSRQKPKACRGAPKYDPEEAAKHKRVVQEQLDKMSRPAPSAAKAVPTTPSKLRAEAPSFTPSPPNSASDRGRTPQGTSPPAATLPPSPDSSRDGAWVPWDRAGPSVPLADRLSRGFPEHRWLIVTPGSATGGLPGTAASTLEEVEDEDEDGELSPAPPVFNALGADRFRQEHEEHLDACWDRYFLKCARRQ